MCKMIILSYKSLQSLLGEIMFSLSYLFSAERLTIVILKARNLQFDDESKSISSMN